MSKNGPEYVNPLAEISAARKAEWIDALILQRQEMLVKTEAMVQVIRDTPSELRDEQADEAIKVNELQAKQFRHQIQQLREQRKQLLADDDG